MTVSASLTHGTSDFSLCPIHIWAWSQWVWIPVLKQNQHGNLAVANLLSNDNNINNIYGAPPCESLECLQRQRIHSFYHTHMHGHTHTLTHTHAHTHTLSLSCTHTHTRTHARMLQIRALLTMVLVEWEERKHWLSLTTHKTRTYCCWWTTGKHR